MDTTKYYSNHEHGVRGYYNRGSSMALSKYEKSKRQRTKRTTEGRCINCGKLPGVGSTRCDSCLEKQRLLVKRRAETLRLLVLQHYGSRCKCCGLDDKPFLTIDHVNNDGCDMRKTMKHMGASLYRWIINNAFPDSIQILCWNCNGAKGIYGECPHETRRRADAAGIGTKRETNSNR